MSAPVTITGRLGADPELRFGNSGVAIVNMRVVTDRRVKEGDEWVSKDTTWWTVTAFKTLAENVAESLSKGDLVIVVGTVKSRDWETKEGEKRTVWEVEARHVGPDLSRATAKPVKSGGTSQPFDRGNLGGDPWAQQSADVPF